MTKLEFGELQYKVHCEQNDPTVAPQGRSHCLFDLQL